MQIAGLEGVTSGQLILTLHRHDYGDGQYAIAWAESSPIGEYLNHYDIRRHRVSSYLVVLNSLGYDHPDSVLAYCHHFKGPFEGECEPGFVGYVNGFPINGVPPGWNEIKNDTLAASI